MLNYNPKITVSRKRSKRKYYIKQKLSGVIMLLGGIISPLVLDGDITASLLYVPLGLVLLLSKQRIISWGDYKR